MQIAVGDRFPEFESATFGGETVRLRDFEGVNNIVVYFYPKDLTPGCTREAGDFNRHLDDFARLDTAVVGVSVDPKEAHERFTATCGLQFPLLTDEGGRLSERLGIRNESGTAQRTTFVVDKQGIVRHVFQVKTVDGHVAEVLETVRSLS